MRGSSICAGGNDDHRQRGLRNRRVRRGLARTGGEADGVQGHRVGHSGWGQDETVPAILRYESEQIYLAFTVPAKKDPIPPRQIAYRDVKSAEYTFGKSPRVAAAILLSPLFLFNSSKSHWLTVKTADDYVLLRLNKSNYKIAIAELEKRAGIKVESVGENK